MEPLNINTIILAFCLMLNVVAVLFGIWLNKRGTLQVAGQAAKAAELLLQRQSVTEAAAMVVAERAETAARAVEKVAGQAAEAAKLLLVSQGDATAATSEVAALLLESTRASDAKIEVLTTFAKTTHSLVNSQFTVVLKAKLEALSSGLMSMKLLQAMNKDRGNLSAADLAEAAEEIKLATKSIEDLKAQIAERERQDEAAIKTAATPTIIVQQVKADERTANATERVADATEELAAQEKEKNK